MTTGLLNNKFWVEIEMSPRLRWVRDEFGMNSMLSHGAFEEAVNDGNNGKSADISRVDRGVRRRVSKIGRIV